MTVLGMTSVCPVWFCNQVKWSRRVCRTSAVAPCSSGSSCSRCWTTQLTDTWSCGQDATWSSSWSIPRRWDFLSSFRSLCFALGWKARCFMEIYSSFWYPGGSAVGDPEESTSYELRQAEPLTALLLRKGHHAEGKGESCFPLICFFSAMERKELYIYLLKCCLVTS